MDSEDKTIELKPEDVIIVDRDKREGAAMDALTRSLAKAYVKDFERQQKEQEKVSSTEPESQDKR